MKLTKVFLLSCIVFAFTACGGDDDKIEGIDYPPGEIPGLGEAPGELTGTPFVLPDGIEQEGTIMGLSSGVFNQRSSITPMLFPEIFIEKERNLQEKQRNLRATVIPDTIVGSGYYVRVFIVLNSKNNKDTEVVFPAGLIVRALSSGNQNGVLLKKASVIVPKNGSLNVALIMYCGNSSRSPSGSYDKYEWGVITDSKLILDLCNRLKNKKINYEEFIKADYEIYSEQISDLQSILWSLTDYSYFPEGLSEEQKKYIENLPNSN